jgi:uncharacterized integral membrane protein (TIGR00697 family)
MIRGVIIPGSSLVIPFSYPIIDVVAEIYGKKKALGLVIAGILAGFIFALIVPTIAQLESPLATDPYSLTTIEAYKHLFKNTFRFTCAGTLGFLISMSVSILIFSTLKDYLRGGKYLFRSVISSSISLYSSTIVAGIITFYGIYPIGQIVGMMITSANFKVLCTAIGSVASVTVVYFLKKKEVESNMHEDKAAMIYNELSKIRSAPILVQS